MPDRVDAEYVTAVFGEHGEQIRTAIDSLVAAQLGAVIVYGDPSRFVGLCDGGFVLDVPLTAQRVFELCKMDGAVLIDAARGHIIGANVNLIPDPGIHSEETGMRHRAADRVNKQTGAVVAAISDERSTVTIYSQERGEPADVAVEPHLAC